jgi:MarR family transcriptional regulator, organic hydroperoxide resistance regulator
LPMWRVLASLWAKGEHNLNSLSDLTSIEISTLSRKVSGLVDQRLVSRGQSGVDWRSINLSLTATGRQRVEQLIPIVRRHEQAALDGIGASDIRCLEASLNQIYGTSSPWTRCASSRIRSARANPEPCQRECLEKQIVTC